MAGSWAQRSVIVVCSALLGLGLALLARPQSLRAERWPAGPALLHRAIATQAAQPISATLADYHLPGTQPHGLSAPLVAPDNCRVCHVNIITDHWAGSMMANSARNPLFRAAMVVANKDVSFAGEFCIRCHSPNAWLNGRSLPPDGSAINAEDLQGVSCSLCHRLVLPTPAPGESPRDAGERAHIQDTVGQPIVGSGAYIVDRLHVMRGPFDVGEMYYHLWSQSSAVRSAALCATCHDIDNPLLSWAPALNDYALNAIDTPASPTDRLFPIERTYSEWANSEFAAGGVSGLNYPGLKRSTGTEDGPITVCQDCHMPLVESPLAQEWLGTPARTVGVHQWAGGNARAQHAIADFWSAQAGDTSFDAGATLANAAAGQAMLRRAAHLSAAVAGDWIVVTVTNNTGHKLPTGYPEGRRMWLRVEQYANTDSIGQTRVFTSGMFDDRGAIAPVDPYLKVYEIKQGLSITFAVAIGRPDLAGEGFHFALNNTVRKDNRIPPRGFTNTAFGAAGAPVVGYDYADGQYWDTAIYPLAPDAARISVTLWYQTASPEYIDFLIHEADQVITDAVAGPVNWSAVLQEGWLNRLRLSQPEMMASLVLWPGAVERAIFPVVMRRVSAR